MYNLSPESILHLNSQKSYYNSATKVHFLSNHKYISDHYSEKKLLHWSELLFQQLLGQGLLL